MAARSRCSRRRPEVAGVSSATWGNAGTLWKSLRGTTPCEPATLWRTLKLLGRDPGHEKNVFINNSCLTDAAFYRWALALARAPNPSDYDWPTAHGDAQRYLLARAAALGIEEHVRVAGGEVRSSTGAVLSSDAGDALGDSALYTQALAADCKARGLHVWTNAPAEAVDGGGVTVDGARVDADAVVLCAGARTATLLPLYVPIHPLRGYSITARVTHPRAPGGVVLRRARAPLLHAPRRRARALHVLRGVCTALRPDAAHQGARDASQKLDRVCCAPRVGVVRLYRPVRSGTAIDR